MAKDKADLNSDIDLKDSAKVEERINALTKHLNELRVHSPLKEVDDYKFKTIVGDTSLSKMFGTHTKLLVIHNMGKDCSYCTLWADGFNGMLPHISDAMSVVLVSTNTPQEQLKFAKSRKWNFKLASHKGLPYTKEQTVSGKWADMPGATVYEKVKGKIYIKNKCLFDPGDIYCPMWSILGLAGVESKAWQPKLNYKPSK